MPNRTGNKSWLNDQVRVPRWAALSATAIAVLQVVSWILQGLLWILTHAGGA